MHSSGGVRIPEQPPTVAPAAIVLPAPVASDPPTVADAPDAGDGIPTSWATAYGHHVPYREAIALARKRSAELDAAQDLPQITTRLDAMTRAWATVFHAPDASLTDKLDAVNIAAAASLLWSRRLDALGLHDSAGSYRTDSRVALSFEDVADGPGQRWRSEGLALAKLCVTLARRDNITATAERCAHLESDYPGGTLRASSRGCACDPNDPLCSSSMSGWCHP